MLHRLNISIRYFIHHSIIAQMALLVVFWLLGEMISRFFHMPIPGGIIGMAMVLLLLATGKLSIFSMKRGAEWLLAEMLLFFIPAVLAILDHKEFLGLLGLKVLMVILCSTLIVMSITALTIDLCYQWTMRHEKH